MFAWLLVYDRLFIISLSVSLHPYLARYSVCFWCCCLVHSFFYVPYQFPLQIILCIFRLKSFLRVFTCFLLVSIQCSKDIRGVVQLLPINRVVYFIQQGGGGQRPMINIKIGFFKNQTSPRLRFTAVELKKPII